MMKQEAWSKKLFSSPPWVMGIINITPDSFSDGGLYLDPNAALTCARQFTEAGAQIIDLGAESTRPGASAITTGEEQKRLSPIIEVLSKDFFLSIDTYHATTAAFALHAGAKMINDVSALRADADMANVVREFRSNIVLMYSKETDSHPHATSEAKTYENVRVEIVEFLKRRVDFALKAGISEHNIVLDPGIGTFISPDPKYSWEILENFEALVEALQPFPLLVGTSRKGFLGGRLAERDPISALTAVKAVNKGAQFVRTHNVEAFWQVFNISDAE